MSSKTVKAALKDAREAIKNKEYQIAIKKCKVKRIYGHIFVITLVF
jgi:hypothetical protein